MRKAYLDARSLPLRWSHYIIIPKEKQAFLRKRKAPIKEAMVGF